MNRILIIGAGGVGNVTTHKCAQDPDTFPEIALASRTLSKCRAIATSVRRRTGREISTYQVDANDAAQTALLLRTLQPDLLLNLALPYQDLALMEACLESGVHYLDTANYEPPDVARFEYKWQWDYHERFAEAGLCALLGSGFDPGVTNVFTAYAARHHFDEIHELDIVDVNGGNHGQAFATNFNPEINIREITAPCRHWSNGEFVATPAMSKRRQFTCPEGLGTFDIYRLYHEELESLTRHFPTIRRAQFWMSFSEEYLSCLEVLQNVGMTAIEPINYHGSEIVPLQFLKSVLPDPGELGSTTTGRTCIGCIVRGIADGQPRSAFLYNVCDHARCYAEVGSQAVSFTTGVPAMIGAKLMLEQQWLRPGVWNMEQFDPDPFMACLTPSGLPWTIAHGDPFAD